VWHEAKQVRANLVAAPKLRSVGWQVDDLENADLLQATLPAEAVIVVVCPAVFDHRLLLDLQQAEGTTLCITKAAEGTMAAWDTQDGQVMTTLVSPAYRATGILRCPGTLLEPAIRQVQGKRMSSLLPSLVSSLAAQTPVQTLDVSKHLWVPITIPLEDTVAAAETQLLQRLGRQGESPVVRRINRPLSRMLTKRLMRTAVTPNQITLLSALIGLSGAYLLAQPSQLWQVLGSLLFLLSTIIDGCDGEIARLTFQESAFGAKLDLVMDNVVHGFLFAGIALGLYRQQHDTLYLILGGLTLGGVLVSVLVYLPHRLHQQETPSPPRRIHDSLASRDFAYLLPPLALAHRLHWFLWATAVGTYLFAAAWMVISWWSRRRGTHP
jgi:phosphatidylglycerophosphate synthase